jgi:hypothetical protein
MYTALRKGDIDMSNADCQARWRAKRDSEMQAMAARIAELESKAGGVAVAQSTQEEKRAATWATPIDELSDADDDEGSKAAPPDSEITEDLATLRAIGARLAKFSIDDFDEALANAAHALEEWVANYHTAQLILRDHPDSPEIEALLAGETTFNAASIRLGIRPDPAAQDDAPMSPPTPEQQVAEAASAPEAAPAMPAPPCAPEPIPAAAHEAQSDHEKRVIEGRRKAAATRERKKLFKLDTDEAKKTRADDARKIEKLGNVTADRGAFPGEVEAALAAIATLNDKPNPLDKFAPPPLPSSVDELLAHRKPIKARKPK